MKYVEPEKNDQLDLVNMLNKGLERRGKMQRRSKMWASSAGLCVRRNTLQAGEIAETIADNTDSVRHMYQEVGKSFESEIIRSFNNLGMLRAADYYMPKINLDISGKIDFIIEHDHELIGIEVKTRGQDLKVKESDLRQAQIYHIVTGLPFYVLIQDRNVQKYGRFGLNSRAIKIEMDRDDKLDLAYSLYLSEWLIKRNLVMPLNVNYVKYDSKTCENCPFYDICPKYRLNDKVENGDWAGEIEPLAQNFIDKIEERKQVIYKDLIRG